MPRSPICARAKRRRPTRKGRATEPIADAARCFAAGDLDQAARLCLDLIARDPAHFDALHMLGVICSRRGQPADALGYLLRAARFSAGHAQLIVNIGNALTAVRRYPEAIAAYEQARSMGPPDAGLLNNLGLALRGAERITDAVACFRAALEANPAHDASRFNLARALAADGALEEADALLRSMLEGGLTGVPDSRRLDLIDERAHTNMALGRCEEALRILDEGAARHPGNPMIAAHRAFALLTLGRLPEGWEAYETRWLAPDHEAAPPHYRVIDPGEVSGKRVLVTQEQGRGDIIQFLRYVTPLAARGARVILCVYDDLAALARELPDVERVLLPDEVAEYELLTSVMSLPLAFRTDLAAIPADVPYLRVPAARIAPMRWHLGPARARRIGIAWSGSAASHARSALAARLLESLFDRTDIEFHCLQKDIRPDDKLWIEQNGRVRLHQPVLKDFADTAALIAEMDLVITIDTAIAHLAGALAKPVWVMLAFNADWRWLRDRAGSPWYPTARLFRQESPGDWAGVVRAVAAAL